MVQGTPNAINIHFSLFLCVATDNNDIMHPPTSHKTDIFLLLGTNMGDRQELLRQALVEITNEIGPATQVSSIYETAAWGNENQPTFLNQVIRLHTSLPPSQLLKTTQS